jgi:D-3-phosphoglycerate dehydrogenase / 2-oxoglutarate reductase
MPLPRVIVTEPIDATCFEWLSQRCELAQINADKPATEPEKIEGLIVRTYTRVDAALLDLYPSLRVVGRAGVGLDNIDLRECRVRNIVVVHTPDANTDAVVEHTLACVLDGLRPRVALEEAPAEQDWSSFRDALITPRQLSGATLGILGFGRIGQRLCGAAHPMSMRVLYHDIREIPTAQSCGARSVSAQQLWQESDVLSIHVDGRASNRHLLDASILAQLKPDAVLINTSRGFVLDAQDMANWLAANPEARAFIDVHEPEPIPSEYPLLGVPNAVCTPHIAAASAQAKRAMSWVVKDVWSVLQGLEPSHRAV